MQKHLKLFNINFLLMKYILSLLILSIAIPCFAQDPPTNSIGDWQWSRNYSTVWNKDASDQRSSNTIRYVHEDSLGGVIIVGTTTAHTEVKNLNGPHSGMGAVLPGDKLAKNGAIITKFDCAGNVLWSHLIGLKQSPSSYGNYYLADAISDEEGNTYIFGYADSQDFLDTIWYGNQVLALPNSTWVNGSKTTLVKIDPNGNIIWAKDFYKDYNLAPASTTWGYLSNKSFNEWRETSSSDRYSIGKDAHCMTLYNDTLSMILNMDSSWFIPNSVYYSNHNIYPIGTYGSCFYQFDVQSGAKIHEQSMMSRIYHGDTTQYFPLLLYIASFSPLGHGQYSMIASIWPQGNSMSQADSLLPTPFLDQIISCQAPYYYRGYSSLCAFRRFFAFTFTKEHLLSFNYLGDTVGVIDANIHPNIPRQEIFVNGARNTLILNSNQKIKSKNFWNQAVAQIWLNQTDQTPLSATRVTESEAILQLGKDNQLKRIIQPDSSKNDFIFGVSGTKHPIAAVYNNVITGSPVSSAPTLPNETWIDGYHLISNQQFGMAGAMQFDGNTGHIINQNYSNKPLNITAKANTLNYAENIYQSEKGNIYYYGHLLGQSAATSLNWYAQNIAIPGDDTTFGQSILWNQSDLDAVLVKFGNSCGAADTVTVAPLEPSWLSATCTDESGIQLHWEDNSHYELGFKIYRAVNKGSYSLLCTLPPNSNSYTDHLVVPASTYHYKVYSYNRIDTSFAVTVSKTLCYADGTENVNPLSTNGKIYPNPSEAKQFTLLYNATQNSTATLSVMSLNGALLYQSRVDIQSNANSFEVVLPSYTPAGTYLVSLKGAQVLFQDKLVLVK